MASKRRKNKRRKAASHLALKEHTWRQVKAAVSMGLGLVLMLALGGNAGPVGNGIITVLTFFFGAWSILFPIFLLLLGAFLFMARTHKTELKRTYGLLLCLFAFLGIVHLRAPLMDIADQRDSLGGAVGFMVAFPFATFLSAQVGYVILSTAMLVGLFITFEPDVLGLIARVKELTEPSKKRKEEDEDDESLTEAVASEFVKKVLSGKDLVEQDEKHTDINIVRPAFVDHNNDEQKARSERFKTAAAAKNADLLQMNDTRFEEWKFPELDLLDFKHSELKVKDEELKLQAARIKEKLKEFDIDVTMKDAHPGPTVTQFTLQPAEGIKLSKIESLKDDLALALAAQSLRIEAPIPGKSLVGIEMPNEKRSTVYLRELLESSVFRQSDSPLTIPLGRGVSGESFVATIEDMPHLLIAGATGAGKSVSMNALLISLLYQNAPHELKFILVDPKRVELMPYNGIPHLLTPVITESEKALQALRWALAEMGRRLHRFSETGVRNLAEYNAKQDNEEKMLPRIVIVIDELADLMMRQHRKDTETMIARIAQMARAVGMHLIIATQRPSVDVITGLIKANIPTRIAFRVVSAVDSRTILDGIGAEDLLGKGDMLYMTASTPNPVRIQGIYISTKEIERVINAVKVAGGGMLTEEITLGEGNEPGAPGGMPMIDLDADDNGGDDFFFDAVRIVQETGRASASLLQRQLKVGYARAARLLDIMEEKGIIGPSDGAKARKVYIEKMASESAV